MKALSYLEISKTALQSNVKMFRKLLPKSTQLTAVIKANAYGHGLSQVIKICGHLVDAFQVDDIEELRDARKWTNKPIYVFGYVRKADLEEAIALDAILGVSSTEIITVLDRIGQRLKKKIKIHLKIDALLGRQGVLPESILGLGKFLKDKKFIDLQAVYSHFSDIEDSENLDHADAQYAELLKAKAILADAGFEGLRHHISATSGLFSDLKRNWGSTMVRLGIGMYGFWPSKSIEKKFCKTICLQPAVKWISHLAQIKVVPKGFPIGYGRTFVAKNKTKIAIVPQGYSDGYGRGFSNNSHVLVRGRKCAILGRVAMNMIAIDASRVPDVKIEDEVVLLGSQGDGKITAEELAERIGTINYEIIARISPLLPRFIK